MRKGTKLKLALLAVAGLGLVASSNVFAERYMDIDSTGGIQLGDKKARGYWFDLTGRIQYDVALYNGDDSDRSGYPSGSTLRRALLGIQGGVNDGWEYKAEFKLNELVVDPSLSSNNASNILNEAYIAYAGYKDMWLAVGQLSIPFSLEDWSSSSYVAFMEAPLPIQAFSPGFGLGVYGEYTYQNMFSLAAALYHPKQGVTQPSDGFTADGLRRTGSDPLAIAGRLTFAPVNTASEVYHFGLSARHQRAHDTHNVVNFSAKPEVRARSTPALSTSIPANTAEHFEVYGLEAAGQWGPLMLQAEYVRADVDRHSGGDVDFDGYYVSAAYVLTGEKRKYDFTSGTFGALVPQSKRGAWEVGARYSYVNLGDEGLVNGGNERDITLGVSWYVNKNVRFMGNYVHAEIDRNGHKDHDLNIFGIRSQITW